MRPIDADALNGYELGLISPKAQKLFHKIINDAPTITPAPKIGRWIKSEIPNEEYVCSECGGACWYYDVEKGVAKSRFCPNCGTKMEERNE